jgi:branched-chain amino acid transport system substrate-binding protein
MSSRLTRSFRLFGLPLLGFGLTLPALTAPAFIQEALAQEKPIRIGLLYDLSGPFAAAGSVASQIGAQIAIDLTNEQGGVLGKYKVEAVNADSQSKPDVAINEGERLINQEHVDAIVGVYSSASAVPLASKVEEQKKILWITTAVATSVFKGRNLNYVFRAQIHSDQYGQAGIGFLTEHAKPDLGVEPKDLKIAIIYEDGPYGTGVAAADEQYAKQAGIPIVLKEAYSSNAPDLSSLVTKLKRARPDVILHAGYNPDITLFLRQAREAGLRFKMLIGNGAGYSQLDKLTATFGADIDNFCDIDPVPAQHLDAAKLAPGLGELIKIMVDRYKAKTGANDVPPHVSMGFNQTWILLQSVLPVAIQKYGGTDAEAIRKAALDVDIPVGGTIQGYGVKFFPPGTELSGQNERSTPVVMQYVKGQIKVVWPTAIQNAPPVLPLPAQSPYAMN